MIVNICKQKGKKMAQNSDGGYNTRLRNVEHDFTAGIVFTGINDHKVSIKTVYIFQRVSLRCLKA